jgi:3D-(3,5/4)-trihydroxycyclohexane-1,2-dione acylhydrolase (decyclizing)
MSATVRLTMAQALVRYLCAQKMRADDINGENTGALLPLFGGVFAIACSLCAR